MKHQRSVAAYVVSLTACASAPLQDGSVSTTSTSNPRPAARSLADGGGVDPLEQTDPGPFPTVLRSSWEQSLFMYANELRFDEAHGRVRFQRIQHTRGPTPDIFICEFERANFDEIVKPMPDKEFSLRVEVGAPANGVHPCRALKLEVR